MEGGLWVLGLFNNSMSVQPNKNGKVSKGVSGRRTRYFLLGSRSGIQGEKKDSLTELAGAVRSVRAG